jgi:hypothetical protein
MHTTTRTHHRCAVDECTNPTRGDLIRAQGGRWHLIDGFVYSQDRRAFVGDSWAQACQEHRDTVAQAVRADVDGWHDRWSVQVRTLDYGTAEASDVIEYAQGIGTDDARLF